MSEPSAYQMCFALVEGAFIIIGKETSGESGNWRNVQRKKKKKKSRNYKRMKGR
jgi:hypothetical protein